MRESAVSVARTLLSSPAGEIAELWVRSFADDAEAHDDDLQEQLELDFVTAFDAAQAELGTEYGPPHQVGAEDGEIVPLNGVFRVAWWSAVGQQLWLAASHEDRECPFLLLMGTAP